MEEKVKCWAVFECRMMECPVYTSKDLRCWLTSGTYCRDEIQGVFLEKMEICLECKVFKANMDAASMEETIKIVSKQFKQFREMFEEQNRKLEKSNNELMEATVQSEKLSALGQLSAGVAHELNQPLNGIKIIPETNAIAPRVFRARVSISRSPCLRDMSRASSTQ